VLDNPRAYETETVFSKGRELNSDPGVISFANSSCKISDISSSSHVRVKDLTIGKSLMYPGNNLRIPQNKEIHFNFWKKGVIQACATAPFFWAISQNWKH
jgi:hypothetical protein